MYKLFVADISCGNLDFSRLPQDLLYLADRKPNKLLSKAGMLLAYDALRQLNALPLRYDNNGKPISSKEDVHLSISHTENMAVCAVSDCHIGVDIELKDRTAPRHIIGRFSPDEQELANRSNADFIRLWTAKEAFAKCEGIGIGKALNINMLDDKGDIRKQGFAIDFEYTNNFIVCICEKI